MISRQQIKIMLKNVTAAFNFMVAHTKPRHANTVVSWGELAEIIGQDSVRDQSGADGNGDHVYTTMPMSAKDRAGWAALQPAMLRVIKEARQ